MWYRDGEKVAVFLRVTQSELQSSHDYNPDTGPTILLVRGGADDSAFPPKDWHPVRCQTLEFIGP